jgi:hypothetical protein
LSGSSGAVANIVNAVVRYIGSQKLSEMLLQPYDLHKPGWADNYLMGLLNQASLAFLERRH